MKKLTAILLSVAMIVTLGACGKKADDANGPIKIGVVGARTGESSLWGDVMYHTVQLLADEVNENGGLLGGRQIQIMSYDNRDDAVETTNVARKAILNDGVCAFIGCEACRICWRVFLWVCWRLHCLLHLSSLRLTVRYCDAMRGEYI